MKKITAADTLSLSIDERIELVKDIWDTIDIENVDLTDAEKKLIDKRLESYHQNPKLGSPWKDVYTRIIEK